MSLSKWTSSVIYTVLEEWKKEINARWRCNTYTFFSLNKSDDLT